MWAVYLCGCTDCFLHAMFMSEQHAKEWADLHGTNPEGYMIEYWETPKQIDTSDTGWQ
jgi:hypothetical protein